MKKRLLFVAFALLTSAASFAFEAGEYAYNSTQRFKIDGPNLVTNGDFASGLYGWFGADPESSPSADVWSISEEQFGPNGEKVVESVAPTEGMPLCNSWKLDAGTYVVSYQIKAITAGYTTVITGGSTPDANAADFFVNGDGSFTKAASTDEAPVVNVASQTNYPAGEWKTIVFYATVEDGQRLVMHFEKLTAGTLITNIEIHQAQEVYDVRKSLNRLAIVKEMMNMPEFDVADAQDLKAELVSNIEVVEGMITGGEFDDASNAESMMDMLEESIEAFFAVSSVDAKSMIPGLDIASLGYFGRGGIGSNSAKWKLFDGAGNWGHLTTEPDVLRSAIQNGYAHSATYKVYHEDFPAGKYFFTCEVRNANTDRTSWPTNPIFNLKTDSCLMFIGTDTIKVGPIEGEEFQRFSMVADVKEDGQFYAGIYWPGVSSGGAFFIRNTIVRAFNKDIVADVEHIQAFKTYMTQWDAATNSRTVVYNKIDNANYPWGQNELKAERDRLEPYYTGQRNLGWSTADGADAGIASTEELLDWANYQGIEEYNEPAEDGAEPTRKTYQLVRGYQAANNAIVALNKVITDLAEAIDAAKKTRNTGAYLSGDRDTYKTAILAALETLKTTRANTTDATREADSTVFANAKSTLDAATETFLASVSVKPFIDIDFSKGVTENVEPAEGEPTEGYYFEGNLGRMYTSAFNEANSGNTNYTLGYGEELMDMLRVGNGQAIVYLDSLQQPGDDDCLRVTFDFYHGSLSGRFAGVELQNEANQRVAGFYLNRYNGTLSFNDFNDVLTNGGEGLNILEYATGVGSSSASNVAIAAESNRTSYDLVIDYHNKTLQGTMINSKNGTCEGKAMPFRTEIEDQKIVKFVLVSNYTNEDRRCWFDNLKISKYGLADVEEDITDSPWAETTPWLDGIKTVNTVAADGAIYNLAGQKVKAATKGIYIINGRKVVIK